MSTKLSKTQRRNQRRSSAASGRNLTRSSAPVASLTKESFSFMPIFPVRVRKTLRYASFGALTSTSGAVATHVLKANGLFDPDFTSTGHQPMGFDQMMLFYNHFCVTHSKLWVTFKNSSSGVPTVCLRVDADSTPLTVPDRILEFGGNQIETLEVKGVAGCNKTLFIEADIARLQGISPVALTADPSLSGNAAADPTEVTYFHIQLWDNAAVTSTCNFDFVMEQTAWFVEPRNLIESLRAPKKPPEFVYIESDVKTCPCQTRKL